MRKRMWKSIVVGAALVCALQFGMTANAEEETHGWHLDRESWYYVDANGSKLSGWLFDGESWYYLGTDGVMQTGWINDGSGWYYLDAEAGGRMSANQWKLIDGSWYYLFGNGRMASDWLLDGESWYYLGFDGAMRTGWINDGSGWYYLDAETGGRMSANQWKLIDGNWYYLFGNGKMASDWLLDGESWYYLGFDGAMRTGWQNLSGTWYYFYSEQEAGTAGHGKMACNTTIEGYEIDENGITMTADRLDMIQRAQGCTSSTDYLLLVDTTTCRTGVFTWKQNGWELLHYWLCAPGAPESPTVLGTYMVQAKGYTFYSFGSQCYYYTQFYGDYLFHSITYNTDGTVQDGRVGMQLSHGCVRLETEKAKWIYETIPTDTTVMIY